MSVSKELDEVALRRARDREPAAFRQLVDLYEHRVFALLSRMLWQPRGRAVVEEVAQETFLRVYRARPGFSRDGSAKLSTWILTIASRLAIDELRRPVLVPLPAYGPANADTDSRTEERHAVTVALKAAVTALPPVHRAAFLLREVDGLGYREISQMLGIEVGTVRSRLSRARKALQVALREVHHG